MITSIVVTLVLEEKQQENDPHRQEFAENALDCLFSVENHRLTSHTSQGGHTLLCVSSAYSHAKRKRKHPFNFYWRA